MKDYLCRMCGKERVKNIAIVVYRTIPEDYSISIDNLVCNSSNCIREISYDLSEGRRDRSVKICPLTFDSLNYFPAPERERLEKIIKDLISYDKEHKASR
ncbi:MAG: hypothetical protein N3G19_02490 [Candidatus Pacearchaeota archaeon]|nr:hypothetical protein [Candidatus Pacearchaeota archaeon]